MRSSASRTRASFRMGYAWSNHGGFASTRSTNESPSSASGSTTCGHSTAPRPPGSNSFRHRCGEGRSGTGTAPDRLLDGPPEGALKRRFEGAHPKPYVRGSPFETLDSPSLSWLLSCRGCALVWRHGQITLDVAAEATQSSCRRPTRNRGADRACSSWSWRPACSA